ncbi:BREX system serine/threonine kinase PglW [Promicromonospora sp. NPDC050262]|uniref:BREX system serine/threonine kinase PglW n=1 Tax=Promicromonospora sp. NPDC050262 TaxID=3155036 RepID=UPI0033E5EBE2
MLPDSHWFVMGEPASPAEAEALARFREVVPHDGINTGWANLTFIDEGGRTAEIDVLLLTRFGFFLAELKGWHGTIRGTTQTWYQNRRSAKNPYLVTDLKARKLRSVLLRYAKNKAQAEAVPFHEAIVVLHGDGSQVDLPGQAREHVYSLDGYQVQARPALPRVSDIFTGSRRPVVDQTAYRQIRRVCDAADFRPRPKQRMVGDFVVTDSAPIAEGPDWQDVRVSYPAVPDVPRRLRLFDVPPRAAASERKRIEQLARREFQLTLGVVHERIAAPSGVYVTDDGPALEFSHDDAAQPLDSYLRDEGADLSFDERMALIIQLGETLSYAHRRHLIHRALAPARVWVTSVRRGLPNLVVRDWYFAHKERSTDATSRWTSVNAGAADLGSSGLDDQAYLAPEARQDAKGMAPIPLDVYGLGAVAYLILTGKAPATSPVDLENQHQAAGCLDPRTAAPGMPDDIADIVAWATRTVESERPPTIDDTLQLLRDAWDAVRRPDGDDAEPTPVADPVDAQNGDIVADRFVVVSRRGEGSSGVALGVRDHDADDATPDRVLKVARSDTAVRTLEAEAEILRSLDHRRVVRLIEGPLDVDGRTALLLSDAGSNTLAHLISTEGRCSLGMLESLGADLLEAAAYLDSQGRFHRDVKPANIGVARDPHSKRRSLVLFDFSLSKESLEKTKSGTPGYADPYLGRGKRQRYDRAAELWSVSATLYEMATGEQVIWPGGAHTPATSSDKPDLDPSYFETSVATQFTALFRRALHPDAGKRFGSVEELAQAWSEIFATLDAGKEGAAANDDLATQAGLDTRLEQSGLSARAVSGVARLGVKLDKPIDTVADLLGIHAVNVNTIHGLGQQYRRELHLRIRQWRERLRTDHEPDGADVKGVEILVQDLLTDLPSRERTVVQYVLGLAEPDRPALWWPSTSDISEALGLDRGPATSAVEAAVTAWGEASPRALDTVREEVTALLSRSGRVMTVPELVAALLGTRGSLLSGDARLRHASALLRAVYELDLRMPDSALDLRRRRSDRADLIALTESTDPEGTGDEFPPADLLNELAGDLGQRADELVAQGVVPPESGRQSLRAVVDDSPGEMYGLVIDDARLLHLAAAASEKAALSGFDELYPRDLPAQTAVEYAVRGKPGRRISAAHLRRSVEARFSAVDLPASSRGLDDLVANVLPGVVNNDGVYEIATAARSRSHSASAGTLVAATPVSEVTVQLKESLRGRSGITLCAPPRRYMRAADALEKAFDVRRLDVAALVVDATREVAASHGIDWQFVVGVDAGQRPSADWANLTSLVQSAVRPRWADLLAADSPLLVVNPGPLMRYGMSDLLATLLDVGTARPAARWLLVAMHGDHAVPMLEGDPVPLGPSRWITLPSDLSSLSAGASS